MECELRIVNGEWCEKSQLLTYLRRLHAKGYLLVKRAGRNNLYRPAAQPGNVVRELVQDFVARLFAGEALPLVQHLVQDRNLKPDEIDALQKMLDDMKNDALRCVVDAYPKTLAVA